MEEEEDQDYDPHDEVLYLVKWRGLTYQECTWERWAALKDEAAEQVADFWLRHRPLPSRSVGEKDIKSFKKVRELVLSMRSPAD